MLGTPLSGGLARGLLLAQGVGLADDLGLDAGNGGNRVLGLVGRHLAGDVTMEVETDPARGDRPLILEPARIGDEGVPDLARRQ